MKGDKFFIKCRISPVVNLEWRMTTRISCAEVNFPDYIPPQEVEFVVYGSGDSGKHVFGGRERSIM